MEDRFKFRAWHKEIKKMLHLSSLNVTGGTSPASEDKNTFYYLRMEDMNVMQCTGLRDKNGKLIYENDIVKGICSSKSEHVCQGLILRNLVGKEVKGIIRYSDSFAQFYFTDDGITFLHLYHGIKETEVIGNKYENPELLTKTK